MQRIKEVFFIEKKSAPKRPLKLILASFILLSAFFSGMFFLKTDNVIAAGILQKVKEGGLDTIGQDTYNQSEPTDLRAMAGRVIIILLEVLAIIVVLYILWAGFKWMTAGGDTKKVDDAKKQIQNAAIGLLIILASWGLTKWIFNIAGNVTNTPIDGV